jgi:hypothetical protein
MKVALYLLWVLSEDVDSAKGVVVVAFVSRDFRTIDPNAPSAFRRTQFGFAVRFSAIHLCIGNNNPIFDMTAAAAMKFMVKARLRCRVHKGSAIECLYAVKQFGVPVESIPITYAGVVKNKQHLQWLAGRRIIEESHLSSGPIILATIVDCPRANDVLFRVGERGTHEGNIKFRALIEARWKLYRSISNREAKDAIVREIADAVSEMEGRFLAWDSRGWWTEMTDPLAVKKQVGSFIRDYSKRMTAKKSKSNAG